MTTGGSPAIGLNTGINVVLEALNLVGRDASVGDYMNATLTVAEENFGRCSDEFYAFLNAWEQVCVDTGIDPSPCEYTVSGPSWVCEENDYAKFCVQGGLPDAHYRWYIIGKKSTEYESTCGMQGNVQKGCNCLTLIDFPKYPYYPQYITIEVYSPTVGPDHIVKKRVKLVDCNHDDPTCEEYFGLLVSPTHSDKIRLEVIPKSSYDPNNSGEFSIGVFDLFGRQIYYGTQSEFDQLKFTLQNGIYVLVKVDESGRVTSSD